MRLIDADRLLSKEMKEMYYHLPNGDTAIPIIDIEHAPTVNAEPVKNGKWIHRSYYRSSTKMYDCEIYICNKCKYKCSYDSETGRSAGSYNFCPNCGADMRGEQDE